MLTLQFIHEATGYKFRFFSSLIIYLIYQKIKKNYTVIYSVAQEIQQELTTAPDREENTGKWANTANAIKMQVNIYSHHANFDSGSKN